MTRDDDETRDRPPAASDDDVPRRRDDTSSGSTTTKNKSSPQLTTATRSSSSSSSSTFLSPCEEVGAGKGEMGRGSGAGGLEGNLVTRRRSSPDSETSPGAAGAGKPGVGATTTSPRRRRESRLVAPRASSRLRGGGALRASPPAPPPPSHQRAAARTSLRERPTPSRQRAAAFAARGSGGKTTPPAAARTAGSRGRARKTTSPSSGSSPPTLSTGGGGREQPPPEVPGGGARGCAEGKGASDGTIAGAAAASAAEGNVENCRQLQLPAASTTATSATAPRGGANNDDDRKKKKKSRRSKKKIPQPPSSPPSPSTPAIRKLRERKQRKEEALRSVLVVSAGGGGGTTPPPDSGAGSPSPPPQDLPSQEQPQLPVLRTIFPFKTRVDLDRFEAELEEELRGSSGSGGAAVAANGTILAKGAASTGGAAFGNGGSPSPSHPAPNSRQTPIRGGTSPAPSSKAEGDAATAAAPAAAGKDTTKGRVTPSALLRVFGLLCLFRVANVAVVRSLFDPDEFWQTLEPAYCLAFGDGNSTDSSSSSNGISDHACSGLTWEWTRRAAAAPSPSFLERSMLGPVRSYISVLPTYLFYRLVKLLGVDSHWMVSRGPMVLYAVTVAAPTDLAVWYTAHWLLPKGAVSDRRRLQQVAGWCLFCSVTSWFNAYSLIRTFSNSQETVLLALAVALVSPELVGGVDAQFGFHRSCLAFLIGGLSVAVRFTSLAAFVPMGVLLAMRRDTAASGMKYLIAPCAALGLTGLSVAMIVDRCFFGFWTIPFLGNFHFNVVQDLASIYGSHPWHWYLTAGVPAIAGLLLPFILVGSSMFLRGDGHCSYGERNLWIMAASYVLTMSLNAHKEFRFIHPVLPLLCLLAGLQIESLFAGAAPNRRTRRTCFVSAAVVANLVAILYLGLFHQTGPVLVNKKIVDLSLEEAEHSSRSKSTFSVYYLTGACHSTPLHSHLHAPPLAFDTWSLDCSPSCRSGSAEVCESDQFAQDPSGFVERSVCLRQTEKWRKVCRPNSSQYRPVPDYVVTVSPFVDGVRRQLESAGLREVGRFPHHFVGAKLGGNLVLGDLPFGGGGSGSGGGDDDDQERCSSESAYGRIAIVENMLEVAVEEVVLFSRKHHQAS